VLEGAGVEGPIVLASHSLGGGVAQFYADRYPDRVAGLVFIDTIAIPGYVDWFGPAVDDGTGGSIDRRRTAEDWELIGSFGSIPTIVLTQNFRGEDDFAPQRFRRYFRNVRDELAGRSSDTLHVIAKNSGHGIHEIAPDLVTAAITEVIEAVRSREQLRPCDESFAAFGGVCARRTATAPVKETSPFAAVARVRIGAPYSCVPPLVRGCIGGGGVPR